MNEEIKEKTVILPPFKHFIMTVGAIPTSYLESMTYYEMLVWFTNYLGKTVIPAINENGEAVTELQNLFRELQDYVNNYFDNLDVQEEINNKLDDMVEQGTLQEIIADYLNSKAVFGFDNVESMKESTNLIDGSYAETLGYYTKNDGGKALYKIRKITNDDVVDEMFILEVADDSLIAELVLDDTINVKQLGAKENDADIGAMINTIVNTKNKIAYVPTGTYNVTTTIEPENYKTINIDGKLNYTGQVACIKVTGKFNKIKVTDIDSNGLCLLMENNSSTANCKNNEIIFDGYVRSTTTHCIKLHSIEQGVIYNRLRFKTIAAANDSYCIYIKTESTGTYSRYVAESTITGGQCIAGTYGIFIDTSTSGANGEVTGMHFETISFEGVTNGIYINNARGNNFTYCRYGELSGHYIKFKGTPNNNQFQILSNIYSTKLDLTELADNSYIYNFFDCNYTQSSGTTIASKMILHGNKIKLKDLTKGNKWINITTEGDTYTLDDNTVVSFIFVSTSSQPTIKLNQYYGSSGIDYLFVETNRGFTLVDNNGETITSGANGPTTYRYYCHCYNKNDVDKWYVEKIAVA